MRVARIGFTPLKGGHHTTHDRVDLALEGPIGDREFCLFDPATGRALRTVQHPALVRTVTRWSGTSLSVDFEEETFTGVPIGSGTIRTIDYWGRDVPVEIITGPWAAPFSAFLDRKVELARRIHPGDIVYGAPVSLISTSSLRALGECLALSPTNDLAARFRMTFVVDTDRLPPHVEDQWIGTEIEIGTARIRLSGPIARCSVININPDKGTVDAPVLQTLADYRHRAGEILFGVDAVITNPGTVGIGDKVANVYRR